VLIIHRRKTLGSSFSALLNPSTAETAFREERAVSLLASVIVISTDTAKEQHSAGAKSGL